MAIQSHRCWGEARGGLTWSLFSFFTPASFLLLMSPLSNAYSKALAHSREKPFKQERALVPLWLLRWLVESRDKKKGSGYRCLPLMWGCACEATFQFKGLGCCEQVSISFKCSRRRFISRLLDRSWVSTFPQDKHPSKPAEAAIRTFCQDCLLLPRCDGWPTSLRRPRHGVTRRRLHVEPLSYSTAGTGVLVYASLIHAVVSRAAIFACVILLIDMRVACAAFCRDVKAPEVWSTPLSQSRPANIFASLHRFSFIQIQVTESTLQTRLKMYIDVYEMHVLLGLLSSHWLSGCDFHTEKKMWLWLMALKINQWTQLLVNKKRCQKNADGKRKEKNPHCFWWATANHHCTRIRFALLGNSLSFVKQRVVQEVWMSGCVFVFVPSHYNFQCALFVHVWRSYKSHYCVSVCCVKNGETRSDIFFFFWSR